MFLTQNNPEIDVVYKGKKIEYVGFSHTPSFGMQKNADFSVLLTPDDIEISRKENYF
ncbi:MAG: hypothetical protein KY054_01855 [Candidatus Nealsonbacteria bacterium]|nr:hypothetical protein [Candidatus Nealsonbacteria bacterium]